ncbi:hypothetical protein BVRB_1g010360 [Beta vulgaris subsp. vulgaris]|uniref:uncharacterized protein LOC104894498 isoform X2 n=1 Tax=Beta vulgaris subsp. vulgaris TaxID=3555 RepID=UPI0005401AFE|nr:uncharacterized protein LOC104894498 isoform X2 [Beta vulgaris subsp. vulgaris]KMT19649.1 hypothetical protein BVRB_1g010360 [Beta vulgaris subsp. vulgaris]
MKMTWKKKSGKKRVAIPNLPFEDDEEQETHSNLPSSLNSHSNNQPQQSNQTLADAFVQQGNNLAEDGKYREALGKWEAAITLMPEKAILHEQKAQVLLEVGESWGALKAATRATELDPSWAEAWITLGRAQLNFGEPDSAMESFDKALAIKPELAEAQEDRQTAMQLMKKRKHLHTSGLSTNSSRFAVGDEVQTESVVEQET